MATYFYDETGAQAARSAIQLQVGIRQMQQADYSLVSYEYTLSCRSIMGEEDGTVYLLAMEDSIQNFAQNPDIPAERFDAYHRFTLIQEDGAWKIQSHMLFDPLYMQLFRTVDWPEEDEAEAATTDYDPMEDLAEAYIAAVPEYLEQLQAAVTDRETATDEETVTGQENVANGETVTGQEMIQADHSYDRESAFAYADLYADERNEDWADYTGSGGNCQNYASQCLVAGGIPMDVTGQQVWKWYDRSLSNGNSRSGRSSSWTSVTRFMEYAEDNAGYGLVAVTNASYDTGETGDLIHMGADGSWGHTVIITEPVLDASGQTVDYLVDSNTANLRNYPASLYGYPNMILTKIIGWND